jgi:hypothetical protein
MGISLGKLLNSAPKQQLPYREPVSIPRFSAAGSGSQYRFRLYSRAIYRANAQAAEEPEKAAKPTGFFKY